MGVDKVDLMGVGIESDEDMEVLLKAISKHFNPDQEEEEEAMAGGGRRRRPSVFMGSVVEEEVDIELPLADFLGPNSDPNVDDFLTVLLPAGALSSLSSNDRESEGEVINADEVKKALKFAASFLTPLPDLEEPDADAPPTALGITDCSVCGDESTMAVLVAACGVAQFAHNAFARWYASPYSCLYVYVRELA